jgi:hypothetical protein
VLAVLVVALAHVSADQQDLTDCAPRGDVRFVCGLGDPEDLIAIPRSEWIVASAMNGAGLHMVNTRNPQFWGSSTAVQVGREIWMGAPAGTRIARYPQP